MAIDPVTAGLGLVSAFGGLFGGGRTDEQLFMDAFTVEQAKKQGAYNDWAREAMKEQYGNSQRQQGVAEGGYNQLQSWGSADRNLYETYLMPLLNSIASTGGFDNFSGMANPTAAQGLNIRGFNGGGTTSSPVRQMYNGSYENQASQQNTGGATANLSGRPASVQPSDIMGGRAGSTAGGNRQGAAQTTSADPNANRPAVSQPTTQATTGAQPTADAQQNPYQLSQAQQVQLNSQLDSIRTQEANAIQSLRQSQAARGFGPGGSQMLSDAEARIKQYYRAQAERTTADAAEAARAMRQQTASALLGTLQGIGQQGINTYSGGTAGIGNIASNNQQAALNLNAQGLNNSLANLQLGQQSAQANQANSQANAAAIGQMLGYILSQIGGNKKPTTPTTTTKTTSYQFT